MKNEPIFPILGLFLSFSAGLFFRPVFDNFFHVVDYCFGLNKKLENWINFRKGEKGEEKAYKNLKDNLSKEDYVIFRGCVIPNTKFDFDIIVVGITGLIYFQIKNYKRKVALKDGKLFVCDKYWEIGRKFSHDPRKDINSHCKKLNEYLNKKSYYDIKINKALVFMNGYKYISSSNPQEDLEEGNEMENITILDGRDTLALVSFVETREDKFSPIFISELSKIFDYLKSIEIS
jgi:hypothetical protein